MKKNETKTVEGNFEPSYLIDETLYQYGEYLGEVLGYKPGEELDKYVKRLGGNIHYSTSLTEDESRKDGSIEIKGYRDFDIYLPNFTGSLRDRFTIGHELGHYFLHSKGGKITGKLARYGTSLIEYEANCFSAGFLMPEKKFQKCLDEKMSVIQIAGRFETSWSSVKFRRDYLEKKR